MSALLDSARLKLQQTDHEIRVLPIVILYLNNICDSRCQTCEIWKNNGLLQVPAERQMPESLLEELYRSAESWRPRQVLLSGGEPALHPKFAYIARRFRTIASTVGVVTNGLLLSSYDPADLTNISAFYISFDAPDRESYEQIRGVDGFERLGASVKVLNSLAPRPHVVARCTLQRANVARLPELVRGARQMGFDTISFLNVDVTSEAFSRNLHGPSNSDAIRPTREDLVEMEKGIALLDETANAFIEGGVGRLQRMLRYFRALLGEEEFPEVRCNAPWVSIVIETTGKVRGCFFQPIIGDFRNVNSETATAFRRSLVVETNATCRRCVCSKQLGVRDFFRL